MLFYAVANGRNIGIFLNWNDCNTSINGYKNAIFKKFNTKEEAEKFIQFNKNIKSKQKDIIDFNADYYVYTDGACSLSKKSLDFSDNLAGEKVKTFSPGSLTNLAKPNLLSSMLDFESKDSKLAGSNNGKYNAIAGIGIFFGINDHRNISKKIEGKQTNNTAELTAIIETYNIIENDIINGKKIIIVSDSKYAILCVSSYGEKCYKKNWNIEIPNKELVKTAYELYKDKPNIQFMHIKAHTNNTDIHSFGNDNADKLANIAIKLNNY
jgi:ribonuclease HI